MSNNFSLNVHVNLFIKRATLSQYRSFLYLNVVSYFVKSCSPLIIGTFGDKWYLVLIIIQKSDLIFKYIKYHCSEVSNFYLKIRDCSFKNTLHGTLHCRRKEIVYSHFQTNGTKKHLLYDTYSCSSETVGKNSVLDAQSTCKTWPPIKGL